MLKRFIASAATIVVPAATVTGLVGCANVHVSKVSVQQRQCGADQHVHGFRYYLSRPYIVVSDKVILTEYSENVVLAVDPSKKDSDQFVLVATRKLSGEDKFRMYSLSGADLGFFRDDIKPFIKAESTNKLPAVLAAFNGLQPVPQPAPQPTPQPPQPAPPPQPTPGPKANGNSEGKPPKDGGGGGGGSSSLSDVIQVVNLPDFEEQYAIKNCNVLAQSKYDLHFADGWALQGYGGSWDSTQVALALFNSLKNAIDAVKGVQTEAISKLPHPAPGGAFSKEARANMVTVTLTRRFYIEPGIYRLQKSWERAVADPPPTTPHAFAGMFSNIGLELRQEISFAAN